PIPAGYGLRVPAEVADGFTGRLSQVGAEDRVARATPDPPDDQARRTETSVTTHRVKPGQTLTGIAEQYGISLEALCTANRRRAHPGADRAGAADPSRHLTAGRPREFRGQEGSGSIPRRMRTHPVFLCLEGRRCIAVGGDPAIEDKVRACHRAGAEVAVIATE